MAAHPKRCRDDVTGAAPLSTICAYVDRGASSQRIVALLRAQGLHLCQDWHEFRSNGLGGAEAAICVISELHGPVWNAILQLRTHRPAMAMMLITEQTRENGRALGCIEVDELLFLDEVSDTALETKTAALTRRTTTRIAAAVLREEQLTLDPEIAGTVVRACVAKHLVRSVEELARLLGCSSSQLERRWQRCTPSGSKPKLFIKWLRLMHALNLLARTRKSWKEVAGMLGVKPATLANTSRVLFGVTLRQLEHLDRDRLLGRLWEILGILPAPRMP